MKKILFILILITSSLVYAKKTNWNVELLSGNAHNFPSRVTVKQEGYSKASKIAQWSTRPMGPAPYYSFRINYWKGNMSIEGEMLHHKLYMDNTDEVFNQYNSTFGFNFFFVNRGWKINPNTILRFGIGPVVSHPVNMIRGQRYSSDVVYNLVGLGTQISAQLRQTIYKNIYLTEELKLTYAEAELPIENGTSYMTNTAIHGLIGLGYDF